MIYTTQIKNLAISKILNGFLAKNQYNFDLFGQHVAFDTGYMVGGIITSTLFNVNDTLEQIVAKIGNKLEELLILKNMTSNPQHIVLGLWQENDTVYIDISQNINDVQTAMQFAKARGEKAIYDIINQNSIYL